ncbi:MULTISPECIES: PP2C family serine/threonine-protein phosphatase [Streptomyces]|uniref:Protein phosphatase 2C domain-containing protein n=1 Tax=Streptomyces edwardsiae TaxID=3075527 RepID=A0ABU2QSR9_9ACTN|nr:MULTISPECIES: PP2C family serine/threonine-protein phosphatase [unclassified Streptomyces]MDT0406080.1 protein phosphatase 2C domain-containing protein [Streptomyces sp. DSM 41635]
MSQMPQQAALSKCPSCEEPLESGDRFCGACGYDLSVVPARPRDEPTIAMNGVVPPQTSAERAAPRPPSAPPAAAAWPAPDGPADPAPAHRPADVPGTNSDGTPLSGTPAVHPSAAGGAPPVPPSAAGGTHAAPVPPSAAAGAPLPGAAGGTPPPGDPAAPPAAVQASPAGGAPGAPSSGVRFDRRAEPAGDEYPLQAPDPRVAAEPAQSAGETAAVCVACRAGRVDDDGYCENCGHAQPRERDHMEQECGPLAAVSDRGLRHHRNEDAFAVGTAALPDGAPASVAVVCDGVSSATRPDEASLAASTAASESLLAALPRGTHPQQAMHEAIIAAAEAVNALADDPAAAGEHAPQQNAPACTFVGAVVTAGLLVVGWVGDSRVYWVPVDRSAPAARLTEDDSWAAQMVAAGLMGEAEAYADQRAHAITGWLGADAYELEPHTASFKPDRPGVVVVCTDGLWNYAESADEMAEILPADAAVRPLHSARVLVGHALDGGGHDNVTVALVPFPAVPQGAGSA